MNILQLLQTAELIKKFTSNNDLISNALSIKYMLNKAFKSSDTTLTLDKNDQKALVVISVLFIENNREKLTLDIYKDLIKMTEELAKEYKIN